MRWSLTEEESSVQQKWKEYIPSKWLNNCDTPLSLCPDSKEDLVAVFRVESDVFVLECPEQYTQCGCITK